MSKLNFEWDSIKNTSNIKKHKVSFEEAKTVFLDDNAAIAYDPDNSIDEERFIIIGFSLFARLILVCFCERNNGNTIRIISARKLTKKELKDFNRRWVK
ncbi:MAG: BrnT family toxin [Candidatus Brocadiaceae bacterium]|nr:BrnT family toxin [Candidatus Brocadiaceae bacterium]